MRTPPAGHPFLRTCVYTNSAPPSRQHAVAPRFSISINAGRDRCSSTSSDHALVNAPSRDRQAPQIAEQQIAWSRRLPARSTARCRCRSAPRRDRAFQASVRPLPHPRSSTRSPGPGRGTAAACRSGFSIRAAAARSTRAARRRAALRRGTSSVRRTPERPQIQIAAARLQTRGRTAGTRARSARVSASAPRQSGHRTRPMSACGNHDVARRLRARASSRSARASQV